MLDQTRMVPHNIPADLKKMKNLYEDLFSDGKYYRGALVQAVAGEFGLPQQKTDILSQSIEYIHNASLLHDDILDDAPLRRGKKSAWKKYGGGYAILAGDYLLAKVIKNLSEFNSVALIEYTSETILNLIEGEWLQDQCHNKLDVTQEEMQRVHSLKTSVLFSWCFKAPYMATAQGSIDKKTQKDLLEVGELFGSLLQRSDDLLDYNIRNFENKTFFKDLPAGYFNSFTIHLLADQNNKENAFGINNLNEFLDFYKINLDQKLKSFDAESESILNNLKNLVMGLEVFSVPFKESLIEASKEIYWRTK